MRSHKRSSAASDKCAVLKCTSSMAFFFICSIPALFFRLYQRHNIKCQAHGKIQCACQHIIMCYAQENVTTKRRAPCTDHTTGKTSHAAQNAAPGSARHERRGLADPARAMDQHRTGARVACLSQYHHQPHATRRIAQSRGAPLSQGQRQAPDSLPARRSCGRLSRGG
jgi:hypothetical protein